MLQTIFTLFLFLGGVFMYLVHLLTFESRVSNIYKVLGIILAFIPAVGFIAYTIMYLYDVFNYQKDSFRWESDNKSVVRGLWINRLLFNDVDWDEYDAEKLRKKKEALQAAKEKAEREKEEAERRAKELHIQREKERRDKLVHGLSGTNPPQLEPIEPVIEQGLKKGVRTVKTQKTIDVD